MPYNPELEYEIIKRDISIEDFHKYAEEFVVRPPYQRKTVWSKKKQQSLLDSLFRRYYIPRIVFREIRLNEQQTINEVIDGQQRITTVQNFFNNQLPLPKTLEDLHADLAGAFYEELSSDFRRFIDKELIFPADVIKGINDPTDRKHQYIATVIFERLQQGEALNYMEIAHSQLSSLTRNFVVKYSDDQTFDYDTYLPVDENPNKHPFFQIIKRKNDRMQHLSLMTRFLMLEAANGPCDIKNNNITDFIKNAQKDDGIGNYSYESAAEARRVISTLNVFYEIFKPLEGEVVPELSNEYFIISFYLLIRHLRQFYVFDHEEKELVKNFMFEFHARWKSVRRVRDQEIMIFSEHRQMSVAEIEVRDQIIRQLFFEYAKEQSHEMLTKDERRNFSEADRIMVYRANNGMCQMCLDEDKPEKECIVPWSEFEADHVLPHSRGGRTEIDNAQVLCRYHNRSKGNRV